MEQLLGISLTDQDIEELMLINSDELDDASVSQPKKRKFETLTNESLHSGKIVISPKVAKISLKLAGVGDVKDPLSVLLSDKVVEGLERYSKSMESNAEETCGGQLDDFESLFASSKSKKKKR